MPLDWQNERYVRFYQRETPDQALWSWQARALWPWLVIKAERDGELRTKRGTVGIASLVRLPDELVAEGMAELLSDGCVVETDHGFALPNYVEAQTAVASDTKRKADQRSRERLAAALTSKRANKSVTRGHDESRGVTTSHAMSLRSDPSGTEPSGTEPRSKNVSARPMPSDFTPTAEHATFAQANALDLAAEVERCRDWHASNGKRRADWSATFRNWLRNAVAFRAERAGRIGPRSHGSAAAFDLVREAEERDAKRGGTGK